MREIISSAVLDAVAILFPVDCAGCGAPDRSLCARCVVAVRPDVHRTVLRSGLVVHSALRYEGVARAALLALKESGRRDISRTLARSLGGALDAARADSGATSLAAIPSSRPAFRRRGYDPVRLLLAKTGEHPPRALRVLRVGAAQKTLDAQSRALNAAGSLDAVAGFRAGRCLLVDDVLTTGATLEEAARALRARGVEVVGAATLMHTPRVFWQADER